MLEEYLTTCAQLSEKMERLDHRIAELAQGSRYEEKVRKLNSVYWKLLDGQLLLKFI